jgi:hypothetical protein
MLRSIDRFVDLEGVQAHFLQFGGPPLDRSGAADPNAGRQLLFGGTSLGLGQIPLWD